MTTMTMTANARSERLTRLGVLQEPLGYVDGGDVYEYVRCSPVGGVDPMGLAAAVQPSPPPTTRPGATNADQDYHDKYSRLVNCGAWAFNSANTIGTSFADQLDLSAGQLRKMLGASNGIQQTKDQANKMFASNRFGLQGKASSFADNTPVPEGWHRVALYIYTAWDPGLSPKKWLDCTKDFHWITQDTDKNWSEKEGFDLPASSTWVWTQNARKKLVGVWIINTPPRTSQSELQLMWNRKHAGGTRGAGFGPTMHDD